MTLALLVIRRLVHLPDFWMLLLILVSGVLVYCGYLALRGNGFYRETRDKMVGFLRKGEI